MITQLGQMSLGLAQQIAPYDTGNLAFNAISLTYQPNGFTITYDENVAPYIMYLEDGTRFYGGAVGFISQDTVYAITKMIDDTLNGRPTNETIDMGVLAEKAKNNPARNELYLKSVGG